MVATMMENHSTPLEKVVAERKVAIARNFQPTERGLKSKVSIQSLLPISVPDVT